MNFQRFRFRLLASAALWALLPAAPALRAQQDATPAPAQGAQQNPAPADNGAQNQPGPAGGLEAYRFPGATLGRSFIVPRFSVQEVYDTNSALATSTGASQASSVTIITGGFSLQWQKRYSTLSMDYTSEGLLYNPQYVPNGTVQQLGITEKVSVRRWNLLFGENFSYLPNSAFGLGGLGYLGGATTGSPGIGTVTSFNPSQIPTQTIVSPNVSQFSSASMFQAQYLTSGRSSVTASVNVGFLHFFGDNLLNNRNVNARFAYDLSLTPRDTLNFSYLASILSYPSGLPGFTSHYIQVGYRKVLTGRLHVFLSAGPSISHFSPFTGQTTVSGGANQVSWTVQSTLDYAYRSGALSGNYTHSVGGGSGYFIGSSSDQFTGSFRHQMSRLWSATFTGGYSRNGAMQQTTMAGGNSNAVFNYWYAGGTLSRSLGRYSSLSFNYNASRQTTGATVCANMLACGPVALTQTIGMTFNWTTRPYKIE